MFVIVYANEGPEQGTVYLKWELRDNEPMEARKFADRVAGFLGTEVVEPSGYIPNCCGDIRVEFTEHEPTVDADGRYLGSVCIWSGESYYFSRDA